MPGLDAPERIQPTTLGDYLEVMSKAVFQTGMSWRVIESKWPGIREAMRNFNAQAIATLGDRDIDDLAHDPGGVLPKVPSHPHQAGKGHRPSA